MEKLSCTAGIYVLVCRTLVISSGFGDEMFKNVSKKYVPGPPRTRSGKGSSLGQNDTASVNIFSRLQDCSRNTNIPILENSSHKPTSREICFR